MRPGLAVVLSAIVFALAPAVARAQDATSSVLVVKVDGSIDRTVDRYLRDAITDAEAEGAAVIVQLDSSGTLDGDPVALAERIHDATVPVVVWLGPAPASAQGAGLLLMYAASAAAVAPGVGVGPLLPLDLASTGGPSKGAVADLARRWADERDRTAPALFPDRPTPAQDALDGHVARFVATSITDLLDEIDGMTVVSGSGPVTLHTKVATVAGEPTVNVRFVDLGPVDRVLHAAASPTWIYVLVVFGVAALVFELTQPGFGFAGFGGVALLGLAVYGMTVVPFSWLGLALLAAGMAAMTADVFVRRLGPLTYGGIAAFATGSVLLFAGVADRVDVSPWLVGFTSLAAFLYWGFALTVAVRSRERIGSTQRGLVGLVGETRGALEPEGPVFVKGTLWRGRTMDGPIPKGTRVRVRAVDGLILRVETDPERDDPDGPGHDPPTA